MANDVEVISWIEAFPCVVAWIENVAGKEWQWLIQTEKDDAVSDEVWLSCALKIWDMVGRLCPYCKFVPDEQNKLYIAT